LVIGHRSFRAALGAVALGSLLAGCSFFPKPAPDPTRHYVLTGTTLATTKPDTPRGPLKLGLRTVQVAPYLEGKSMIVRRGDNEIDYRNFARWAEPVATGVNRMLVARLHTADPVSRVFPQPFPFDVARDIDVSVSVLRCEGRILPDGQSVVSFTALFEIVRVADQAGATGGGEVLVRQHYEAPERPWKEGDYAGLASALSEEVSRLADAIIASLPKA
jgi:uncharacterized lipoprotein YmbA